ncbi:HD domain-containing protein [Candidatus Pacearchaeota archaeon]|nr:HD domain-containing protein [Candidatus Pacearchaeota archaeon]
MNKLEKLISNELRNSFYTLKIEPKNQENIINYLKRIGTKDINILKHSFRVGKLGIKISNLLDINPNKLFYSGLLHDIGKTKIDKNIIKRSNKYKTFTKEDMQIMKMHPLYSYEILKNEYNYSALLSLWHHEHQKDEYPPKENFPIEAQNLPIYKQKEIEEISKFLSVADCYDAAKNRNNGRFWNRKSTSQEVERIMFEEREHSEKLIENLYRNGIFK